MSVSAENPEARTPPTTPSPSAQEPGEPGEPGERRGRPASVQCICPRCEAEFFALLDTASPCAIECPECRLPLDAGGDRVRPGHPVARCQICGSDELYVQKDFNRNLGLGIVLTSFLIILLVMLKWDHRIGIYCLFGLAFVDWMIYRILPEVTVCYLCQSVYRGLPLEPSHRGFELEREEKYKHQRVRWSKSVTKTD